MQARSPSLSRPARPCDADDALPRYSGGLLRDASVGLLPDRRQHAGRGARQRDAGVQRAQLAKVPLHALDTRGRPRHQPRHRRHRHPLRLGLEPADGPAGQHAHAYAHAHALAHAHARARAHALALAHFCARVEFVFALRAHRTQRPW
eukprot:5937401-Pleurochrysis_carterae.AAC.1